MQPPEPGPSIHLALRVSEPICQGVSSKRSCAFEMTPNHLRTLLAGQRVRIFVLPRHSRADAELKQARAAMDTMQLPPDSTSGAVPSQQ